MNKLSFAKSALAAVLLLAGAAAPGQVGRIDPNSAPPPSAGRPAPAPSAYPPLAQSGDAVDPGSQSGAPADYGPRDRAPVDSRPQGGPPPGVTPEGPGGPSAADRARADIRGDTVPRKDVFTAAEGVFGSGARGLGDMIEKLLREQGEPTAYITGREAGGAFVLGVRYGSGTLHHEIEGDRPIYWTGPTVGFDFGADANKVFVLVYNLHDSQRIFHRYAAAEGHVYVVGGFTASYLRRGDIVLIPVRLGVGARLGINAGYMNFTQRNRWLPF